MIAAIAQMGIARVTPLQTDVIFVFNRHVTRLTTLCIRRFNKHHNYIVQWHNISYYCIIHVMFSDASLHTNF